jgi:DNA-directed RNA polymerase specialized sigma24 family protein
MLRIETRIEAETAVIQLEGSLVGPWVDELQRVLDSVCRERSAIALDLAGVSYVDADGERLLRRALVRGPARRPSPYVTALLDRGDREVASALLGGDEATFARLVDRLHPAAVLLARCFVPGDALAGQAACVAWKLFLEKLGGWRGRPSLRALLFRATIEAAGALGVGGSPEPRSGAGRSGDGQDEPPPLAEAVGAAIAALPPMLRAAITLRDVAGCDAEEACHALGLSEPIQRALLHRARTAARAAAETHLAVAA